MIFPTKKVIITIITVTVRNNGEAKMPILFSAEASTHLPWFIDDRYAKYWTAAFKYSVYWSLLLTGSVSDLSSRFRPDWFYIKSASQNIQYIQFNRQHFAKLQKSHITILKCFIFPPRDTTKALKSTFHPNTVLKDAKLLYNLGCGTWDTLHCFI